MDEYQEQRQNEIGIADVFRILLKRIKLLIAVLLAGAGCSAILRIKTISTTARK